MNLNRRWQAFILALFAILILIARANALDMNDYRRLDKLQQEYFQLEQDILDVRKSSRPGELVDCLNDLDAYVEQIDTKIGFISTLASIAFMMVDKSDEQTVLNELNHGGTYFFKYLENNRKAVNGLAGACSWSKVVGAKAQEALRLFGEANSLVRSMLPVTATTATR
jgi:hypothetical protein